jgi:hypothetical protein
MPAGDGVVIDALLLFFHFATRPSFGSASALSRPQDKRLLHATAQIARFAPLRRNMMRFDAITLENRSPERDFASANLFKPLHFSAQRFLEDRRA